MGHLHTCALPNNVAGVSSLRKVRRIGSNLTFGTSKALMTWTKSTSFEPPRCLLISATATSLLTLEVSSAQQ